ncbi:MAG TPA: hypothetical protein VKI44_13785 [Acetobacteraceae bacterium]|nr:hypothetical protein [Acetobacteraceae bacterium]
MPDSIADTPQLLDPATSGPSRTRLESTRYLAAAAYSDAAFRDSVLDHIERQEYRCRAPEFGIDERTVIEECRRADRRWKVRDALLLAVLLAFLFLSGFMPDLQYVLSESPEDFGILLQVHAAELVLLVLIGAAILFTEVLLREHFTLRRRFAKLVRQNPEAAAPGTKTTRQNLVVYGGYSPFVGSGLTLRDWSFSVNLQKAVGGGVRAGPNNLSVKALTDLVQSRLDDLRIPGLEHYHVLFADGRYIRNDRRLMPSPYNLPPRSVPDEIPFEEARDRETSRRTYLCIAITDWSGELVLTTYVRFKQGEANLFAEASSFIVPPLKQAYYQLDSMDLALKIRRLVALAIQSLIAAPFRLVWSPFSVYRIMMKPLQHWSVGRHTRKAIDDNPLFNYGALTSIRQLGMEDRFRVYFQRLDRDMHMKTVEQCLIDAIVDCLEEHDIDTSDIRERRTAILNNGVMISGGVVTAESIAAGSGAKSVVSKLQSMAPKSKGG